MLMFYKEVSRGDQCCIKNALRNVVLWNITVYNNSLFFLQIFEYILNIMYSCYVKAEFSAS